MTRRRTRILLVGFATATTALPAFSGQSQQAWFRIFDDSGHSALFGLTLAANGNTIVVGATNHRHMPPYSGDALLMKIDPGGTVVWERTWGGPQFEQAWAILPVADGYVVFGETDSYGAGDRDFFLLNISEDGAARWSHAFGTAQREWPFGMVRLASGDLFLYGLTRSSAGRDCSYAVRVTAEGDVVWEYSPTCSVEEMILDAVETDGGDIVLALSMEQDGGLRALDSAGTTLWSQRYQLDGWQFPSSMVRSDSGYLLAGFSMDQSTATPQADIWLAEADGTGRMAWDTTFGEATSDDYAQQLVRLSDGRYVIGALGRGMPLYTVDGAGHVLWEYRRDDNAVYAVEALVELDDGGILGAGLKQIVGGEVYHGVLFRLESSGPAAGVGARLGAGRGLPPAS
jgi:outer membrane protein assembly factor BamB